MSRQAKFCYQSLFQRKAALENKRKICRRILGGEEMFGLLKNFWAGNVVQETPAEFSQCEFGCRATVCRQSEWEICKSRILAAQREMACAEAGRQTAADRQVPQR